MSEQLQPEGYYRTGGDETWFPRPDVAGYEYTGEGRNWRLGILREVMDSSRELTALQEILAAPFDTSPEHGITRNMARVVVASDLLRNPPPELRRLMEENLEVLIDLADAGIPDLADCHQAVFSANHESRRTPIEVMKTEIAEADRIFHAASTKFDPAAGSVVPPGIAVMRITSETDRRILDAFRRQTQTSFTEEDAEELDAEVENPDGAVVAAIDVSGQEPRVACSAFAYEEIAELKRRSRDIDLVTYEITGAKVAPDYAGKGLYKAVSRRLLELLAARPGVHAVLGYSNIHEPAVLSVAAQQGRRIVTDTARAIGAPIRPAMQQTLTDGRLVDEIVTYIPGNTLRQYYGPHR